MAFRFSLQAMLDLRKSYERQEKLRLAMLTHQISQLRQQLETLDREKTAGRERLAQNLQEGLFGAEILFNTDREAVGEQRRDSLRQRKAEVEEQRRLQLGVFQKAQQQRKIMENLRDRREQLYRQIQARREQQVLDELFLTRRAVGPPS